MSAVWPIVALGEVIDHRKEFIIIDDLETYRRPRVQLHAQGIVLRDAVPGAEIKTKKQQVARAGDFLVAEIDAKVGGFGIVPDELDGSIVSSHYFLYEHNPVRLDNRYLGWFVKTRAFRQQVEAQRSTNYAAIRPNDVLSYEIPLPPLDEQRRIVAHIEELAAKVGEARVLRGRVLDEMDAIRASAANDIFSDASMMGAPTIELERISEIRAGVTLGRKLTGKTIHLPYLRVANVQDGHLDLRVLKEVEIYPEEREKWMLRRGDLMLTEGGDWDKLGRGTVWQDEVPDCIHQNHIFRVRLDQTRFDPWYVSALMSSPRGKEFFQAASKQTTNLASINQRQLKSFPIFDLPLDRQRALVSELDALQAKVNAVKVLQAETAVELEPMLPAILDKAFKGEL
jgi:type I restriction enzyme, S subunit